MNYLGRLFDGEQVKISNVSQRSLEHLPPILKRSKVEITACSDPSGPLDSASLLSRTSCDNIMFLDGGVGGGLKSNERAICDLNREEQYGQRAIR